MSNNITAASVDENDDGTFQLSVSHPASAKGTVKVKCRDAAIQLSQATQDVSENTTKTSWETKMSPAPTKGKTSFVFILGNQYEITY